VVSTVGRHGSPSPLPGLRRVVRASRPYAIADAPIDAPTLVFEMRCRHCIPYGECCTASASLRQSTLADVGYAQAGPFGNIAITRVGVWACERMGSQLSCESKRNQTLAKRPPKAAASHRRRSNLLTYVGHKLPSRTACEKQTWPTGRTLKRETFLLPRSRG
jgi:hypothetical protein